MLCPSCRRQLERGATHCNACGRPLDGADAALELVLADATRVALVDEVTIGRGSAANVVLGDPTVSRLHARISAGGVLSDAGSSHGTWLDGVRITGPVALHDGATIRLGDQELTVERRRDVTEPGRTIVVRPGASVLVPAAAGPSEPESAPAPSATRPRLRSGYALKRLDASEGEQRWVLRDLRSNGFLRLGEDDAALLEQIDGEHTLLDLVGAAEERFGAMGPARLARLLAELGERGLLADVDTADAGPKAASTRLQRLLTPREKVFRNARRWVEGLYRRGGWALFTRPALAGLALVAAAGIVTFVVLVARVYGTPFVVADHLGLGGAVFLVGRFAIAAVHEFAHGLTMASFGRRIERAGIKVVAIFPYAFVDTSEAWFEPRRRRIAVSLAGPVADFTLGGAFALGCALSPAGALRDILFNLALAAYIGAFFNLNPLLERDGYHVLIDVLREPSLRRRASAQLDRRLSGAGSAGGSRVLARYAAFGIGWSIVGALCAIGMSLRYEGVLTDRLGSTAAHVVMGALWLAFFVPVLVMVGRPLVWRLRRREPLAAAPSLRE